MVRRSVMVLILAVLAVGGCSTSESISPISSLPKGTISQPPVSTISLPAPSLKSAFSVEESLSARRSLRVFTETPLTLGEISQLLWAAQGITNDSGRRTAPSAGGLYPLEIYLVTIRVESLETGIYRYLTEGHSLRLIKVTDVMNNLAEAALGQESVRNAAAVIVISAVYERTTQKYGERGIRYVHMESGHAAQNVCLQATAIRLGAVTIGAFDDVSVKVFLGMPDNENPLYLIPIGHYK